MLFATKLSYLDRVAGPVTERAGHSQRGRASQTGAGPLTGKDGPLTDKPGHPQRGKASNSKAAPLTKRLGLSETGRAG